ncbi:ABC transporter substrate-binding protein [Nitratireductor sp. ZSWI3]|uniref:ABC transporter substrate-binding protein n=1 Tax=Nitratireductor sp. ZSWI3 TaxID=2966359 RepID=UPI0021501889|nr:ABC transporter substrate-binding protein [Nitratireductor sp. ZSWI3]MCR4266120.1 ABC transporter substrate-binding protein [Nitratireductor sp. ZSWI3]
MRYSLTAGLVLAAGVLQAQSAAAESVLTALPVQRTAWIENYNPYNQSTRLPSVNDFIYEPLIIFNTLKGGEANYRLATAYDYADDLKSLTVTLRDGVTWSDGKPFTARDVAFSLDLVKKNKALDIYGLDKIVDTVEVVDDRTIRFHLLDANSGAIYQIVRLAVVPEHVWADVEDPVTFTNPDPVGTGPLTTIRRFTAQEYIQCRNEKYWDAENLKVDCMRFPQIATNDQALAAAARGELDWMGSFLPDIEKTFVGQDPEHHKYWFPAGSLVAFNFNMETKNEGNREAFTDVDFRRAVSMSFDREAMVDIAGYGYPTINQYPSGLGQAFHSWNNPEVDAEYGRFTRYDVDGAKALLEEAGYKDTDGDGHIETPSGKKISFNIIVPNGWTDWINTVQLGVEGLTAIGVEAQVATPEQAVWSESLINGDFDMAMNAYFTGVTPQYHMDLGLHSRHQGKTRFGATRYYNEKLDALLDGFFKTADAEEQRQIMNDIQMEIGRDMPYVAVFNNPLWYQYNTKRFTGFFSAENPVAKPVVHDETPERLLHLLSLRPVED